MKKAKATEQKTVDISAPNMRTIETTITGTSPYISNKFSNRIKEGMIEDQSKGGEAKRTKKTAKDFDKLWKEAVHYSKAGWAGIPATSFRQGMISACRLINFKMTLAKLSIFIEPDGFDAEDGTPLVKITKGTFKKQVAAVRAKDGTLLLTARGYLDPGWQANVRITYDADQFREESVANLLLRVGKQVGIGAGRPDSKTSSGIGAGMFLPQMAKQNRGRK
jgi:hypothetical protein